MWDMMRLASASAFLSPECNALKLLDERPSPSYDPLGDKYPAGSVVAVDTGGLLLAVVVTTALQDRGGAFGITAALREALFTITLVWAGAGYTGRFVRNARKIWAWPWRSSSAPTGPRACPAPPPLGRGRLLRLADQVPPTRTRFRDFPSHPRSHDLDRRHLAAQQPPHPLTQFTLSERYKVPRAWRPTALRKTSKGLETERRPGKEKGQVMTADEIIVGIDESARAALRWAAAYPRSTETALRAIHVVD